MTQAPPVVYHIGPHDEAATCCHCGKTGGRKTILLCGPDHPPYNANANYCCVNCIEKDARIMDHHFDPDDAVIFYWRSRRGRPRLAYRGKVVRENKKTVTVILEENCGRLAKGERMTINILDVTRSTQPEAIK